MVILVSITLALGNLDASLKKNTSFIKKLKMSTTSTSVSSILQDIKSLKIDKYLSEIVSAILESKLKTSTDIASAVEIISLLHQRYAEVAVMFKESLLKPMGPPPSTVGMSTEQRDREESIRIAKQKSYLRLLTDLYLSGVINDEGSKPDMGIIGSALKDMVSNKTILYIYILFSL